MTEPTDEEYATAEKLADDVLSLLDPKLRLFAAHAVVTGRAVPAPAVLAAALVAQLDGLNEPKPASQT